MDVTGAPDDGRPSRPVTGSRWRTATTSGSRAAAGRVRRSHAQTRPAVRLAAVFATAAGVVAYLDSGRWAAIHLFFAGALVTAISGVTVMLTVTWSAAPAPAGWVMALQRWCIAAGAVGVTVGHRFDLGHVAVITAGCVYLTGLVVLIAVVVATWRRAVERRFTAAVFAYVAAVAAGMIGVTAGLELATRASTLQLRGVHVTLNVFGLVGLVIAGTVPYFAATVGRTRMATHATGRRIAMVVGSMAAGITVAATGEATGSDRVAAGGFAAYTLGLAAVIWLLPRPARRQLAWAGPRLIGLWAGCGWWGTTMISASVDATHGMPLLDGPGLAVLIVGGYGQILSGSLAYLVPVLRGGGHQQLSRSFATTRSWVALVAANAAAVALVVDAPRVAVPLVAVWVADSVARAARVALSGRPAPTGVVPDNGRATADGIGTDMGS